MFLALFPFSEVVYIIAICLAWVYIALGIMGTHEADATPVPQATEVHESFFQSVYVANDDRTFFWNAGAPELDEPGITPPKILLLKHPRAVSMHFPEKREMLPSVFLCLLLPERAPPVV